MPRAGESTDEWVNDLDGSVYSPHQNHTESLANTRHLAAKQTKKKTMKKLQIIPKKTWKKNLYELLPKGSRMVCLNDGFEGYYFSLSNVYETCEELLRNIYPNNKSIPSQIRATLQLLRDDGVIEFINGNGLYKWK